MEPPSCCGEEQQDAGPSMERAFEGEPVPSLSETITARSVAVSVVLGVTLSVVAMKLSLTSGFLPTLAIPAGLLGFFLSRAWVRLADRLELAQLPFTRQENTVVQTCVVACSCIAYTGGFGSYILAMSKNAAEGGVGSDALNVEEPNVGRLIAFLFLTNFAGLFAILPFRDYFIMRHNLAFPSGTATAHLINTVHTPHGAKQARKQVSALFKTFAGTIAWSAFQWFFAGGDGGGTCGFQAFPAFGLAAFRLGFYFDSSMANVGVGMLSQDHRLDARRVPLLLGRPVAAHRGPGRRVVPQGPRRAQPQRHQRLPRVHGHFHDPRRRPRPPALHPRPDALRHHAHRPAAEAPAVPTVPQRRRVRRRRPAVLVGQLAGTALGCVVNPVVFWAFYKLYYYDGDVVDGPDTVPYAKLYRGIAMLGSGETGLPHLSARLSRAFFVGALAVAALREVAARRGWRVGRYFPSTIAVAVAFFVSPKMSVGMCAGSVVMCMWKRHDRDCASVLSPAVAAGLICGDGFGSLLSSVMAVFKARAPICIVFLSRDVNAQLDGFLATLHKT